MAVVVALVTAVGTYEWLQHRVDRGSDDALRLAAVLVYVGVTRSYTVARALGLTALLFAYLAAVSGLVGGMSVGRRAAMRWLPPLHRQFSLVAVGLALAHATVPYLSLDPPFGGWATSLVPFGQPISWGAHAALYESLGILAVYLVLLTGPTYYLAGRRRWWGWIHRSAYAVYGLSVAHAFLLGSDFIVQGPLRVVVLAAQVPLLAVLAARMTQGGRSSRPTLALGALAGVGAAAMAVLTVLVAAGGPGEGMRI